MLYTTKFQIRNQSNSLYNSIFNSSCSLVNCVWICRTVNLNFLIQTTLYFLLRPRQRLWLSLYLWLQLNTLYLLLSWIYFDLDVDVGFGGKFLFGYNPVVYIFSYGLEKLLSSLGLISVLSCGVAFESFCLMGLLSLEVAFV